MATKRLTGAVSEEFEDVDPAIDVESEDITELMGDVDAELDQVTSEFGKDKNDVQLKIKLHRVLERKGEREWLFDILPSELPIMDRVKEEYGGGRYEASLFKNGKLYRKFNFNIANPKIKDVTKTLTGEMANVVTLLVAQQEKSFNQLRELMLSQKPAQPFNMMEMMTGMVTLMVQMKNLLPAPVSGNGGAGNIELLLKGFELAKEYGNGGNETSLLDLVRDFIKSPVMEKVIEGASTPVSNVPTTPVNPALAKPQPVNITAKPQGNNGGSQMNPIVKGYINQLIKKAAQDSDPELYAAFILDNVPEDTVREYLLRPDLMTIITSVNPQAAQYAPWFEELKNNITEMLTEDAAEHLTVDGNGEDTTGNALGTSPSVNVNEHPAGEGGN